jgi:NhaP-type Na+/H+ or K+/H+ antiporter
LLNDGVSIVLFESFLRYIGDGEVVDRATIQDTLSHFVLVTVVSVATGAICGAFATLYFYALQGKQKAVGEVAMFCAWALVPYYVADGLGFSGIIAIMVMGFMMDYYVFGGHQSDEGEWMDYMELSNGPESLPHPVEPCFGRIKSTCAKAFSGKGLILSRSRHHVGFVASVLSTIMETSIFSYLGLFLFNDHIWDFGMTISGLVACVTSRAGVVILLSLVINACVWIDLEGMLGRLYRFFSNQGSQRNDDDSSNSGTRVYLDMKTQMILFSAGVRGAVSYALVQNIPVYDAVTKHGSHFKGELRSMTSATIVILLFTFGALTYFTVQRDLSPDRERVAGPLTHRLLSTSLDSNVGEDLAESDVNSTFEIEGRSNQLRECGEGPL